MSKDDPHTQRTPTEAWRPAHRRGCCSSTWLRHRHIDPRPETRVTAPCEGDGDGGAGHPLEPPSHRPGQGDEERRGPSWLGMKESIQMPPAACPPVPAPPWMEGRRREPSVGGVGGEVGGKGRTGGG
ncbi:hypothetical protein E2C01_059612 [Portunus trituberculatus]|uniref:Uncharacterized protein n=1 Tax=Portunus trituberculatus TaxID=210409 RepID=A0A5B7H8W6_PORTR|nr:hypothetical protein [Portunus trituberculatus]